MKKKSALVRQKYRQILPVVVHRPEIIVADAEIQRELFRDLPGILGEQVESVHENLSFGIPDRHVRSANVPRKKIGQAVDVRI